MLAKVWQELRRLQSSKFSSQTGGKHARLCSETLSYGPVSLLLPTGRPAYLHLRSAASTEERPLYQRVAGVHDFMIVLFG